jgi:hypothetical protein
MGLVFRKAINRPSDMVQASFLVASVVFLGVLRRLIRYIVFLGDKSWDDRIGGFSIHRLNCRSGRRPGMITRK